MRFQRTVSRRSFFASSFASTHGIVSSMYLLQRLKRLKISVIASATRSSSILSSTAFGVFSVTAFRSASTSSATPLSVTEKPEILFARLDLEEVQKKVEELHPPVEEEKEEEDVIDIEAKPEITFDDFGKMQFQVGEIIACEEVKKSRKLLCSQVKIGSQVKQIVSGIKGHYTAEEMVGKKVMVLVNLKPAKLAGVLSEGMLLCAEDAEGNLALMTPEKSMPAGAEIC